MSEDSLVGIEVVRTKGDKEEIGVVVGSDALEDAKTRAKRNGQPDKYDDMVAVRWKEKDEVGWHKKGALEVHDE